MRLVLGSILMLGSLAIALPAAAQGSSICKFNNGPRAGQTQDYAPMPAVPIGTPCQDGAGSAGVVVAPGGGGGGYPYGAGGSSGGGNPGAMSSVCYFTGGPRADGQQDYAPRAPLPVGTPCQDGAGSYGVVR